MTTPAVAARYARALVDVVVDPKSNAQPAQITSELRAFAATLEQSPELRLALASPAVSPARKKTVIARVGDTLAFGRITRNFLFALNSHRRMDALAGVIDIFEILLDERLGFSRANISSAQELDAQQRAQLETALARLTGKRMRLKFSLDRSLIGGLVARIGSTVYDGSVRGRLEAMERRLTGEEK